MSILTPETGGIVMASHIYPIGSTYTSVNNINPSEYFGGEWKCIHSDYDKIYLCSQVVHKGSIFTVPASSDVETVLSGNTTEGFTTMNNIMSCPSGYKFKYRFSYMISCNNSSVNSLRINDVEVANGTTWSGINYRHPIIGDFIELGVDITPSEITDIGYSHIGYVYSLYTKNNSTSAMENRLWDVTKHLYAVSNDKFYKWIRIA